MAVAPPDRLKIQNPEAAPDGIPMMALLARICPALKLRTDVGGWVTRSPHASRWPEADGVTTTMLSAMAFAVPETPHAPAGTKFLPAKAPRLGPPRGPFGLRVSTSRQ